MRYKFHVGQVYETLKVLSGPKCIFMLIAQSNFGFDYIILDGPQMSSGIFYFPTTRLDYLVHHKELRLIVELTGED